MSLSDDAIISSGVRRALALFVAIRSSMRETTTILRRPREDTHSF